LTQIKSTWEVSIANFLIIAIIPLITISVFNCTSSSNKTEIIEIKEQEAVKNNIRFAIAPGQVVLQATVIETNKLESKLILSILVKKVLEYGSATPPIANGSNLIVFANESILNTEIHNNELINVVMRHIEPGPGEENNTNWQILRFK
jgi:hypothetical protein